MFTPDNRFENAIQFSRFDKESLFSSVADFPFMLDDIRWKTVEHYYQACKFTGLPYAQTIIDANDGEQANQLGNKWLKRKVSDWKLHRQVFMTRGMYRRVKEYPDVKQALLDTGDALLVEKSQYDYYWGIGRDQRGENRLGKVWMDIRQKIIAQDKNIQE